MRVERRVSRCAREVFAFFPGNVLAGLGISKSFCETKVNQVNVRRFLVPNEKIVWLDVSVQIVARLHVFDSFQLQSQRLTH